MKTTKLYLLSRSAFAAGAFSLAALMFAPLGHAEESAVPNATGCTVANLAGGYGATLVGTVIAGTVSTPLAVSGRLVADGAGHITSIVGTASLGGLVLSSSGTGTYTVNPNCTGSASFTTVIQPVNVVFTLIQKTQRALVMQTDTGYVVTGEFDKQ